MNLKILLLFFCTLLMTQNIFAIDCNNPTATMSCDYYRTCLEPKFQCGDTGYPIGHGEKYCMKFLALSTTDNPSLSLKGILWRNSTLKCLQSELDIGVANKLFSNCEQLNDYAFDSHPSCYTLKSASICELPLNDWKTIASVPSIHDYVSVKSAKQMISIITSCSQTIISQLKTIQRGTSINKIMGRSVLLSNKEIELIAKLQYIDEINHEE